MKRNLLLSYRPMESILSLQGLHKIRNMVPGMKALLAPPVSVETVGLVAAAAAGGKDVPLPPGILSIQDMNDVAK